MKNNILSKFFKSKKTLIVAELSGNHNLSLKYAIKMINEIKRAGADAVKIQLYTPDTITFNSFKKDFILDKKNKWSKNKNLYSLYKKAYTPWKWYKRLNEECRKKKLIFFPSVFDRSSVDYALKNKSQIVKIASPEINDIDLLEYISKKNFHNIMLSTGLGNEKEISEAVKILRKKNSNLVLMKCNSAYPTTLEEMNLVMIKEFQKKFKLDIGLSDHSTNTIAPAVAVSLGAKVIEKHFCISKNSIDGFFSLNPKEFKNMVAQVRDVEKSLGKKSYEISKNSKPNLFAKRSLYVVQDVKKNEVFTSKNVKSIRPSFGLNTRYLKKIIGKKSKVNIKAGNRMKSNYF